MSFGKIGYPDGTRLQQQQALDPIYSLTGPQVGNVVSPVVYAGDYGYLAGNLGVTGSPVRVFVNWWADAAGLVTVGTSALALATTALSLGGWTTAVRGPYFSVHFSPVNNATAYTPTAYFFLSNTPRKWAMLAFGEGVYDNTVNLAAGANAILSAAQYASGKVAVFTFGASQGMTVELDQLSSATLALERINFWTVAANAFDYREVVFPASATQVILTNSSGVNANNGVVIRANQEA